MANSSVHRSVKTTTSISRFHLPWVTTLFGLLAVDFSFGMRHATDARPR